MLREAAGSKITHAFQGMLVKSMKKGIGKWDKKRRVKENTDAGNWCAVVELLPYCARDPRLIPTMGVGCMFSP